MYTNTRPPGPKGLGAVPETAKELSLTAVTILAISLFALMQLKAARA